MATDDGEELTLVVDDALRTALRGGRPGPSRLENQMDSSLSPRDIQARIRAGESLEALAEVAGMDYARVERFAAPVLAEREHIAGLAVAAPVRRRGETAAHRNLRVTVGDRLLRRGVDIDTISWDAHRLEDGRWAVTADYRLEDADRHATFTFDQRGRFSVPGDDEARWLIGEEPPGSGPTRRRLQDGGDEPTVDLSDELALVRATQEQVPDPAADEAEAAAYEAASATVPTVVAEIVHQQTEVTVVRALAAVPDQPAAPDDVDADAEEPETVTAAAGTADEDGTPGAEETSELTALYAMLGSDGYSEDSPRVYAGLSDAAAVPEVVAGTWEPAIVVNYPVEPSPQEEAELPPGEHPDRSQVPMDDKAPVELSTPVDEGREAPVRDGARLPGTDEPAPPYARTNEADRAEEAEEFQLETEPPPEPKQKRKRASVPSWDEIMFGGPKPPS